jgi:solute carrier family 30 (zinc transporter), member 5/7
MRGIYLHVLADTLGSVAVIISTLLTKYNNWSGWDPVASVVISILIFVSAIPLIQSSGMRLLLALPDDVGYKSKEILLGVGDLRGVVGYSGVRFWVADKPEEAGHHQHDHGHEHSHDHGHGEACGREDLVIQGIIHVIAAKGVDLDDVRERTTMYLRGRGVDAVVQVEREGESKCWCSGGLPRSAG